ncbi:MAG: AAA family ATPase [Proteobacteria bacterium]|nr:AAA family ATPase [Pseudomonadota bacterium]
MTEGQAPQAPIGHLNVQREIRKLHADGRLPHAVLLHGPKGIGKRLLADRLAWYLICGQGNDPFEGFGYNQSAPAVPQLLAGAYPYLHILTPEEGKKSIRIEQVREKLQTLSLTADGWRVVIVDSADEMTEGAANALLKTLEEPNSRTLLILISHNPSKLLPTIISRCRQYRLSPLEDADVRTVLAACGISDTAELATLSALAAGCPGEALQIRDIAPKVQASLESFFTAALSGHGHASALQTAELLSDKKLSATSGALLLWWLAACARKASGMGLTLPPAQAGLVDKLTARLPAHGWARLHGHVAHRLNVQQEINLPLQLTLENALQDVITSLETAA